MYGREIIFPNPNSLPLRPAAARRGAAAAAYEFFHRLQKWNGSSQKIRQADVGFVPIYIRGSMDFFSQSGFSIQILPRYYCCTISNTGIPSTFWTLSL